MHLLQKTKLLKMLSVGKKMKKAKSKYLDMSEDIKEQLKEEYLSSKKKKRE